jgi:phosphonopyruvate decarboxylase
MNREAALKIVVDELNDRDIVVSTTGMLSRELFEYRYFFNCLKVYFHKIMNNIYLREIKKQGHEKDFLTVGSMGHASAIALGLALNKNKRQVNYNL